MSDNKQKFAEKARIANEFELADSAPLKFYSNQFNQVIDLLEIDNQRALKLIEATGDQYLRVKKPAVREKQEKKEP